MQSAMVRTALKAPPAMVEFRGLFTVRLLLGERGRKRVIPTELSEALGLQRQALQARAKRRFSKGCSMMELPSSGGLQQVLTLDLRYLPALLLTVDVTRVRREIRPRLEEIQEELYDALAAYTFEGSAVNPGFAVSRDLADAAIEAREDVRRALKIAELAADALAAERERRAAAELVADVLAERSCTASEVSEAGQEVSLRLCKQVEALQMERDAWREQAEGFAFALRALGEPDVPTRGGYVCKELFGEAHFGGDKLRALGIAPPIWETQAARDRPPWGGRPPSGGKG